MTSTHRHTPRHGTTRASRHANRHRQVGAPSPAQNVNRHRQVGAPSPARYTRVHSTQQPNHSSIGSFIGNFPVIRWAIIGVILIVIALALGGLLFQCSQKSTTSTATSESKEYALEQVYASPFDWNNLSYDASNRPLYQINGETYSHIGIDVSANQGAIDWNSVAADGIEYAFIRVAYRGTTEGGLYEDEYAQQNIAGATNAGLKIGAYVFSQATSTDEAREEAQMAIDMLDGYRVDYPVVFDLEMVEETGRAANLTREQVTEVAQVFCDVVADAGYTPMLYGNIIDLHRIDPTLRARYPIWFAQYNDVPEARFDFGIWQYSHTATVSGISTPVDMNIDLSRVLAEHYENPNYQLGGWR